jgi:hypothetical protein
LLLLAALLRVLYSLLGMTVLLEVAVR